jgi:hypothetical protein
MRTPMVMNVTRGKVPLKYGIIRTWANLVLVPLRELQFLALTRRGVSIVPPPSIKLRIIRSLLKLHQPGTSFVETCTYLGDTTALARRLGHRVISINLDPALYARAQYRFRDDPDVVLVHGGCVTALQQVLPRLTRPAVLWLDAHHSGGITAGGPSDDPILACLTELRDQTIRSHSLLIDDVATFDGQRSRPDLVQVMLAIRAINSEYRIRIQGDIIVATVNRTTSSNNGWKIHSSVRETRP